MQRGEGGYCQQVGRNAPWVCWSQKCLTVLRPQPAQVMIGNPSRVDSRDIFAPPCTSSGMFSCHLLYSMLPAHCFHEVGCSYCCPPVDRVRPSLVRMLTLWVDLLHELIWNPCLLQNTASAMLVCCLSELPLSTSLSIGRDSTLPLVFIWRSVPAGV